MSILKRVPNDIELLRPFIQQINSNRYYYYAIDAHRKVVIDEEGVDNEVDVPGQLIEFGNFKNVFVYANGEPSYRFVNNKEKGLYWSGYDGHFRDEELKDEAFRSGIVYTDYPPAAGSVPLTYNDYLESMRVNDLDGGRKKTRHRKNRKSKKTQRRGKQ